MRAADLLARHGAVPLVFPAYPPRYNGSCEPGIRAMKARTEDLAFVRDRAGHWTADDLDHRLRRRLRSALLSHLARRTGSYRRRPCLRP